MNYLAIDIGGSKIIAGIVSDEGKVLSACKEELPAAYGITDVMDTVLRLVESLNREDVVAAGVTIPGLADPCGGIWKYAPFSGIAEVPIAAMLEDRLGFPVFIENDVNACAIGEKVFGNCQDDEDFMWVTISNGIGGTVFLNGDVYRGGLGNAGEIGHIIVEENTDAVCGCGKKGCLEAVASGKGIEKSYRQITGKALSARQIALAAEAGDDIARQVFEKAGFYIGKAVANGINLLNLKKIVFGGGVTQSFHLLERSLQTSLEQYVFAQANPSVCITRSGLGYYAALIGAATVAQKRLR